MKTEEDEAFDDLARKQGMWGGGFHAKRAAAADKTQEPVLDLDGHVVGKARKPKGQQMPRDAEIARLNEKVEFLARTNMLYSDWEHRETQVTSELIRKGIEEAKINAELRAEIEQLKAQLAQPAQEPVALVVDGVLVKSELPEKYTGHLYTTPPKREWIGLTDEERNDCLVKADPCECLADPEAFQLMDEVEAVLKGKNNG